MDRGAWWATVHGVTRVGHNLMTKPPTAAAAKSLQSCPTQTPPQKKKKKKKRKYKMMPNKALSIRRS